MMDTLELLPPEQPFLFEDFADDPRLVVKAREYLHNGRRALRDDARCQAIVSAILNGAPKVAVMQHFRVGYETLTAIFEVFESAGRVRTLKEQQAAGWGSILVLSHWRINEKLVHDEMPAQVLPMLAGIAHDKIEGMTHSGGEDGAQKRTGPRGDVAATIAELRKLLRPAGESVSPASALPSVAVEVVPESGPTHVASMDTVARSGGPGADEEGGGGLLAAAARESDGLEREISEPKEGSDGQDWLPGSTPSTKEEDGPALL